VPFVLDASVAICWAMHDESDARADAARTRAMIDRPIVPALWWYEVRNILVLNERRGRISEADSERFIESTGALPHTAFPQDIRETLRLARNYRLSVYDSAYLALAKTEGIPLATLDRALEAAARAEGVEIVA
jgi:predicted nucleic acid-binding protein